MVKSASLQSSSRRDQVVDGSLRLIHTKGFKGTTMRDIASVMDCDVANLYNFIRSKHDILEHALFGISAEFHKGIDLITTSGYDPSRQIGMVIGLYVRLSYDRPYQIALLTNEWRHLTSESKRRFLAERAGFEQKLRSIIELGVEKGDFATENVTLATELVLSSVRWLFDHCITDVNDTHNPLSIERQITTFVLNGLAM